eukprot:NODE_105_length_2111_cov_853.590953.p1 GENE.NODE_105_length_2111_cov_853.590953~~NODE_105_length_2111_cov_853.590953.p1  ORF type:complete len:484 (-),score=104.96 NODE_105_length_2111_cov_853.590953:506-1957(-)
MAETLDLSFPEGFVWGTATAAYQIEGAVATGGRTPSIWDTFAAIPGKVAHGHTGADACDHYHRFREDVALMRSLGFSNYRFSISWPRLLPAGRGEPNPEAVAFYSALLDELRKNGIAPFVTLYHWDLPQCLEDEYGGWLGRQIVADFEAYAALAFRLFGDRVGHWLTLNEPWCSSVLGYCTGEHAPGRKEKPETETYLSAHHMILAHASAVRCYRQDFKHLQGGKIGLTINVGWFQPFSASHADAAATQRCIDWQLGWFCDPIYNGDYPPSMRAVCKERLPEFTATEKELVRGSNDFFGLNHYSTHIVKGPEGGTAMSIRGSPPEGGYFADLEVTIMPVPGAEQTDMGWDVVPWGLKRLLLHIQKTYAPMGGVLITENGCAVKGEDVVDVAVNDIDRVRYFQMYLSQLHGAIQEGADVRGYFAWSMFDNFEWGYGYAKRFGIVHVDYTTQARTPKQSARMMAGIAVSNVARVPCDVAAAAEWA